jgi:acylphosphatase
MSGAARIVVRGRVQGVGFRAWTVRRARGLGLSGWVRNRADGSVEILVEGPAAAIEALANACRSGPSAAAVTDVARTPAHPTGAHGFAEAPST